MDIDLGKINDGLYIALARIKDGYSFSLDQAWI